MKKTNHNVYVFIVVMAFVCLALFFSSISGCAGCRNSIAANGGIMGSYEGQYVVVSYAGTSIADVWVLRGVFVQSEENSDGWRFIDNSANVVHLGGDVKVIRINDKDDLDKWHDYHMEWETQTYQEKYGVKAEKS